MLAHLKTIWSSPLLTFAPGLRGLPLPPDGLELQAWAGSCPCLCYPRCYSPRSGDPHFNLTLVDPANVFAITWWKLSNIYFINPDFIICRCFGGQSTSWGLSLHPFWILEKTINVIHTSLKSLRLDSIWPIHNMKSKRPDSNKETNKRYRRIRNLRKSVSIIQNVPHTRMQELNPSRTVSIIPSPLQGQTYIQGKM